MAVVEQEIVFTSKDSSGNTVIQYPLTTVEQVDGGVASVNGILPDADGNVEVDGAKYEVYGDVRSRASSKPTYGLT